MRRSAVWRALLSVSIAVPLATIAPSIHGSTQAAGAITLPSRVFSGGLSAAEVLRLAQGARQRAIVILRDQHPDLLARGASAPNRTAVLAAEQAPILHELTQVGATRVRAYHLINAIAATVSAAEAARLQANPLVLAVVPDVVIRLPAHGREQAAPAASAAGSDASAASFCSATRPQLNPEALQVTNTAFDDPAIPQAQSIVSGRGVTVAWIADGLDPNNPDFIRPDGSHVFKDYEDFSGDGVAAPTGGGEAFGDASSIAAQGRKVYDVNQYINVHHQRPTPCLIRILGMAPGASLIGLNVFGQQNFTTNSTFVQAIEYAVDHGADVINESFGGNPLPDTGTDPTTLADDAAVAAGVTVVASTGDAGTANTIGSPATDPKVIAAGGTTTYRLYAQAVVGGIQLGGLVGPAANAAAMPWVNDNITSLSSGGIAQSGLKTPDVVAPGDSGWALCTPDPAIYAECTDNNGQPASIEEFGGTSESSPLAAGEAALVIEAYRHAHGGVTPAPALVKQIIMSTATDLGSPSYEQGAGLINSLKAVQAALSYQAPGAMVPAAPQGAGLLVAPTTLSAAGAPNSLQAFALHVTNTGARGQVITPTVRTLDAPFARASYTVKLDPATDPTIIDLLGRPSYYVEQDFTVPVGTQRLDAALAYDTVAQPAVPAARMTLFDPRGRFVAYTLPQGSGQGYGHVDARFPAAGTWRAFIWARTAGGAGYTGPVHVDLSFSRYKLGGLVVPARQFVAPGQTASFTVLARTPAQPGDENADVAIGGVDTAGATTGAGVVPLALRSLAPLGPSGGAFGGTLTGGNGRPATGPTLTYEFDVPAGLRDLGLSFAITDTNYNLQGVLVDPNDLPIDVQSTATTIDPHTGLPSAFTNTMQFFRRDPRAGRWKLILLINNSISGAQTSIPFVVRIAFNGVLAGAIGLPNNPGIGLKAGRTVTATVVLKNTGNTTKDFFVDPRLAQSAPIPLGGFTQTVPLQASGPFPPSFFVPTEATQLIVAAASMSPTVPFNLDLQDNDGTPPSGNVGSPEYNATSFFDPLTGDNEAVAFSTAPEVVPGTWSEGLVQIGPFPHGLGAVSTALVGGAVIGQPFDATAAPSTGDPIGILAGQTPNPYAPLTLAPGQSGAITVRITPAGPAGTVVRGNFYVDSIALDPASGLLITGGSADELKALPYAYTVTP